jgi:hypothetical protein
MEEKGGEMMRKSEKGEKKENKDGETSRNWEKGVEREKG